MIGTALLTGDTSGLAVAVRLHQDFSLLVPAFFVSTAIYSLQGEFFHTIGRASREFSIN